MNRMVLRLPKGLAERIVEEAEEADMLPTEYVRSLLREAFKDEPGPGPEAEDESEDEEEGGDEAEGEGDKEAD